MASLYIKDPETAAAAARVAARLGITKTEAVRRGLAALEPAASEDSAAMIAKLRAWQAAHPLGEPTGMKADKAFYDSLYADDDDALR